MKYHIIVFKHLGLGFAYFLLIHAFEVELTFAVGLKITLSSSFAVPMIYIRYKVNETIRSNEDWMVVSYKQLFEETFDSHIFGGSTFNLVPIGHKRNCLKMRLTTMLEDVEETWKCFAFLYYRPLANHFSFA